MLMENIRSSLGYIPDKPGPTKQRGMLAMRFHLAYRPHPDSVDSLPKAQLPGTLARSDSALECDLTYPSPTLSGAGHAQ